MNPGYTIRGARQAHRRHPYDLPFVPARVQNGSDVAVASIGRGRNSMQSSTWEFLTLVKRE
jgi:hypothetical protein